MSDIYNTRSFSLQENTTADRDRRLRVLQATEVGTKVIQNEKPLLSIDTGVLLNSSDDDTDGIPIVWTNHQEHLADTGSDQLGVSIAREQFSQAQQARFRTLYCCTLYRSDEDPELKLPQLDHGRLLTNCLSGRGRSSVDSPMTEFLRVYNHISRINHSCRPNAIVVLDDNNGNADVIVIRQLGPNEELTANYLENDWLCGTEKRILELQHNWDFLCDCVDCHGVTSNEGEAIRQSIRHGLTQWNELKSKTTWTTLEYVEVVKFLTARACLTEALLGKDTEWVTA